MILLRFFFLRLLFILLVCRPKIRDIGKENVMRKKTTKYIVQVADKKSASNVQSRQKTGCFRDVITLIIVKVIIIC